MDANSELLNKLLNLDKVRVMQTEFASETKVMLFVESTQDIAICPDCGEVSNSVHDLSDAQIVRDLSVAERRCFLSYRARRFDCGACGKTFVERVVWKRPGASYTMRYEQYIYQRSRKEPVSQIAEEEGLSEEAVQAIFENRAKKRLRHGGTRR